DMVVMTHLHRDHVGWNLTDAGGRWVPTFPKARYWVSTKDWEACHAPDIQHTRYPNARSCVWPLADPGLEAHMDGAHRATRARAPCGWASSGPGASAGST